MTQNKTTPLSEKAVSIGDIDYEDNSVSKRFFRKEDVKEAVRNIINRMWKHKSRFEGIKNKTCLPLDYVEDIIEEEVGKELCKEEKQDDE